VGQPPALESYRFYPDKALGLWAGKAGMAKKRSGKESGAL
jgi:hypothetical protein